MSNKYPLMSNIVPFDVQYSTLWCPIYSTCNRARAVRFFLSGSQAKSWRLLGSVSYTSLMCVRFLLINLLLPRVVFTFLTECTLTDPSVQRKPAFFYRTRRCAMLSKCGMTLVVSPCMYLRARPRLRFVLMTNNWSGPPFIQKHRPDGLLWCTPKIQGHNNNNNNNE